jgi:hypothetical protein
MSYCAICGREHDPDLPCFDSAGQVLRSAGIDDRQAPDSDFKRVARLSDRWFIKLLLALLVFFIVGIILSAFRRYIS